MSAICSCSSFAARLPVAPVSPLRIGLFSACWADAREEAEELEKDKGEEFSSAGGAVVAADVNTDDLVALALASCR